MILPTIHLNGSSKSSLIDDITNAAWKLRQARTSLENMYPNERDYYPQGSAVYQQAREEHDARIRKVTEVMKELEELATAIDELPGNRNRGAA